MAQSISVSNAEIRINSKLSTLLSETQGIYSLVVAIEQAIAAGAYDGEMYTDGLNSLSEIIKGHEAKIQTLMEIVKEGSNEQV